MVYTDHEALISMFDGELKDRLARWQLKFSVFNCIYTHVPGRFLAIADGLSRIHGPPSYQREGETEEDLLACLVGVNLI
jgi:hypothetical protein